MQLFQSFEPKVGKPQTRNTLTYTYIVVQKITASPVTGQFRRIQKPDILVYYNTLTNQESFLAANSNGRKFVYNCKGLDAGSLLVK